MRLKPYQLTLLIAAAGLLAALPASAQDAGEDEGVPPNVLELSEGEVIVFENSYGKLSPEDRVLHFRRAVVRGFNEHFEEYDRPVEEGDITLETDWKGDYMIKFHSESILEVSERDAESRGRDSREDQAEYWRDLVAEHIIRTQPDNDPEVVF